MEKTNHNRAVHIIGQMISTLELDLSDLIVLTEVGSNNYLYTPIIAAMANAKKVYAWTRDTQYGAGEDIKKECLMLARQLGLEERIEISVNERKVEHINRANIITNSGLLRPIDKEFLKSVSTDKCVIPVMYEAWELRESDLDLEECKNKGIKVAGTWENHPAIKVFDGIGPLSVKLAMEAGFEVYQNNIVIWGDDDFGETSVKYFERLGAESVLMTTELDEFYGAVTNADFVYFCSYHEGRNLIGTNGIIDMNRVKSLNPAIGIVHLYGDINEAFVRESGLKVYPEKNGFPSVMSETLAYLGERPLINLQAAGFKVAQNLIQNVEHDLVQKL